MGLKSKTSPTCSKLSTEDMESWLEMDEGDPRHELLSEEIVQSVLQPAEE